MDPIVWELRVTLWPDSGALAVESQVVSKPADLPHERVAELNYDLVTAVETALSPS